MDLQSGVFPIQPEEFPHVVEVWEASVRATHDFVSDADIEVFRPLLREELPQIAELACVRASDGQLAGFVGVADGKVEMLFIHPAWRGQGGGARLLHYAVTTFGATTLDVNEQNGAALGFYLRMGFEVVGRSETDGMGKPYPLLHMRLAKADGTRPNQQCEQPADARRRVGCFFTAGARLFTRRPAVADRRFCGPARCLPVHKGRPAGLWRPGARRPCRGAPPRAARLIVDAVTGRGPAPDGPRGRGGRTGPRRPGTARKRP